MFDFSQFLIYSVKMYETSDAIYRLQMKHYTHIILLAVDMWRHRARF